MPTSRPIGYAIVGSVVGIVLSFVPFSTIVVGAVAGFLEGVTFVAVVLFVIGSGVAFYTIGLSMLGGYLGVSLAREYPQKQRHTRRRIGTGDRLSSDHDPSAPRHRRPELVRDRDGTDWAYAGDSVSDRTGRDRSSRDSRRDRPRTRRR
ncbi:hypothetical protein [Natronobacterium gregoryi]|uniref:Uncharacterized protein n=2 Tax=Natronobacterium gregoryi TaxID=44930 RepID=L0AHZ0_NATGS|nr:hypothetical protein [Natronobacterium gregoryi]AFZ72782.1 hypothetical protein Natgr_1577 [Natronobacterium gregoryi SP2]ELY69453.1 hypothetical protein C490_08014 [Natronobacterium gregoryi SP2]PLK21124.1 hypothetical protein CYV19_05690 [Natronobacterium gregoryi SP2]SFJ10880.1 hypothetical protein SAMN05443661_11457 [Natronobacterium gregoryi]